MNVAITNSSIFLKGDLSFSQIIQIISFIQAGTNGALQQSKWDKCGHVEAGTVNV